MRVTKAEFRVIATQISLSFDLHVIAGKLDRRGLLGVAAIGNLKCLSIDRLRTVYV